MCKWIDVRVVTRTARRRSRSPREEGELVSHARHSRPLVFEASASGGNGSRGTFVVEHDRLLLDHDQSYPENMPVLVLDNNVLAFYDPSRQLLEFENIYVTVQPYGIVAMLAQRRKDGTICAPCGGMVHNAAGLIVPNRPDALDIGHGNDARSPEFARTVVHPSHANLYQIRWTRCVQTPRWDTLECMYLRENARCWISDKAGDGVGEAIGLPSKLYIGPNATFACSAPPRVACTSATSTCHVEQAARSRCIFRVSTAPPLVPAPTIRTWTFVLGLDAELEVCLSDVSVCVHHNHYTAAAAIVVGKSLACAGAYVPLPTGLFVPRVYIVALQRGILSEMRCHFGHLVGLRWYVVSGN